MSVVHTLGAGLLRRLFDAETAHSLTIHALKWGFGPRFAAPDLRSLHTRVFGLDFPNPIGLAAGFDKNAEVPDAMLEMGFGFAETGTVTPLPQPGNPRPRIFRLREDGAIINRLGFNNNGLAAYKLKLQARHGRPGIVGANIGANKDSIDRIADYITCFEALAGLASYFTINVSSPNTPGLRGLQDRDALQILLRKLRDARAKFPVTPPLLLKIAPDLDKRALADVVDVALASHIDGLIISNTTITRDQRLQNPHRDQQGGLSGRPLYALSTNMLRQANRMSRGKLPLVGVGGVSNGADAYGKIRAGASLVQLYTAMTFDGPALARTIAVELAELLARDGFANVSDAVGADV